MERKTQDRIIREYAVLTQSVQDKLCGCAVEKLSMPVVPHSTTQESGIVPSQTASCVRS